jgi:protein-tyrosine phosphatase
VFEILVVCHANLCRSPLAERLARRALGERLGVDSASVGFSSAGTHASAGSPMHPSSADVLAERGVDAGGFFSRTVSVDLLERADLVLAADRGQRAHCVSLAPATLRRTFTLRQFARLAEAVPPGESTGDMAALLDNVQANRHLAPVAPPADDDLKDPVGRPIEEFRACADEIERSWNAILRVIAAA